MPLELAETVSAGTGKQKKNNVITIDVNSEKSTDDQLSEQSEVMTDFVKETLQMDDFSKFNTDLQAQIKDWQNQNWYIAKLRGGWYGEKTFDKSAGPEIVDKIQALPVFFRLLAVRENKYLAETAQADNAETVPAEKPENDDDSIAVFESCKVELTEEDIRTRTNEWMHNLNIIDEKIKNFEAYKDNHKSEMKSLEGVSMRLRFSISNEWEWRDVECIEDFNWHKGTVEIYRTDTGEKVRTREMNKAELNQRQKELFEPESEQKPEAVADEVAV